LYRPKKGNRPIKSINTFDKMNCLSLPKQTVHFIK